MAFPTTSAVSPMNAAAFPSRSARAIFWELTVAVSPPSTLVSSFSISETMPVMSCQLIP